MTRKATASRPDAHEQVTDRILAALENGVVPWRKPWVGGMRPRSMATGKHYRGINVMLLGLAGHASPFWGTYRQITEHGGQVRKGEHGTVIFFWKEITIPNPDAGDGQPKVKQIPMARAFVVFNADQADGLPEKFYPVKGADDAALPEPQAVVDAYLATGKAAKVRHDVHGQAYYNPAADTVHVPPVREHRNAERYHSTLFHELAHSTGHESRLNRWAGDDQRFGSHDYGREELAAQWAAALLDAETGIDAETEDMSAAYLASWIRAIKADKKLIMGAAAAGQKAADLILAPSQAAEGSEPALAAA